MVLFVIKAKWMVSEKKGIQKFNSKKEWLESAGQNVRNACTVSSHCDIHKWTVKWTPHHTHTQTHSNFTNSNE